MEARTQKQIIVGLVSLIVFATFFSGVVFLFRAKTSSPPREPIATPTPFVSVLKDIEVEFSDVFEIRKEGTFDAVALVKNPNLEYGAPQFLYEFIFTGQNGAELARVEGKAFILPKTSRYVIEPALKLLAKPASVAFKIKKVEWQLLDPFSPLGLSLKDTNLGRDETQGVSRFSGVVQNRSSYNLKNVEVHVVLSDPANGGKPIAAGRTDMQDFLRDTDRFFTIQWPYILPANLKIDARTESNFFENSNFIREYGKPEKFEKYY
ncbi:MAG: hypothetical protein HYS15_02000 [Candidatus Spechtbacteria bacterium]|nr:hypothetical protein [Candidatus Spechtbacteria bacterium]